MPHLQNKNAGRSNLERPATEATEAISIELDFRQIKMVAQEVILSSQKLWTDIQGQPMHYLQLGQGPPLLLVHGLLGGAFCWRFNIPALSQQYSVYAVDLPGSGLSDAPPHTDCSMEMQAQRLLQFIQQLGLSNVRIVASSWGGAISLLLAALDAGVRTPRIRSLVLCAPVNPWSNFGRRRIKVLKSYLGGLFLQMVWPISKPAHSIALHRMYGNPERIAKGSLEGYVFNTVRPGRARNIVNVLRNWRKDVELLQRLIHQVQIPTLLVWGTKDGAVDIRSAETLLKILSNCEYTALAGVGHLPFEEVPEEFNRLVLEFLARATEH